LAISLTSSLADGSCPQKDKVSTSYILANLQQIDDRNLYADGTVTRMVLAASPDFMSMIGTLLPIELCGRS
jgi:hypothetical protein